MLKKIIISVLILSNICMTAFAGTWQKHALSKNAKDTEWEYIENGKNVKGWKYINNNWYYFNENSGTCAIGYDCSYDNIYDGYKNAAIVFINGKPYCFDNNGHMLHDCFVIAGENGGAKYWLNSDGSLGDKYYGAGNSAKAANPAALDDSQYINGSIEIDSLNNTSASENTSNYSGPWEDPL